MGKLICVILGIIIIAVAIYFSTMLWESHRIVALIIAVFGNLLGFKLLTI